MSVEDKALQEAEGVDSEEWEGKSIVMMMLF
jgi:hypothetical protein